jgi:NAD(P)-dependent dehydrogenase (short-subunit alcohol dehydrogenase family)
MGKLEGKIALVTGGNSGIGLATAKRFVNEGAYVFITGRRKPELDAAVNEIGENVTGVQGDVSNLADLDRLFAQIQQEKGKLDIVFANAGIARYAPFGQITEEHFDSIFDINVRGVLFTVQKALPLLPDGAAVILNASVVGSKGLSANSVYSATKAALRSFARTWTTDLKSRHIRVNAVSPGPIDTPGLNDLVASAGAGAERMKAIPNTVPLGRLGTPDVCAKQKEILLCRAQRIGELQAACQRCSAGPSLAALFDSSSSVPRGLLGWSRIGAQAVRARGTVPALAAVSGPAVGLVVVDRSLFALLACQKFYGGF